ncbi:ROK family protein [Paenibacillus mucilaginosus 3016]|uniref:ROK family protein n=2 Tax=Paenibacillus mucilaginosus TaxID=61624 RepID=H6NMV2_9BACL|nr:ROK family protein [Paenibacillus mucilaginosus]AFC30992.1 ROK family protein [Paenibacillus mucilaginosus 3016]AFH63307.1 ROK family transcriptional regulator [Paenibacillus mucilaginosus K02]WFA19585.1 ROK family protein [Paenibacillus mucilaginosus]
MDSIGGNSLVIREVNLNLVRRALKEKEQATKRELALATGLSTVTVGTLLQELTSQGEVKEAEMASSGGGRPAQLYSYNGDYAHALILFPHEAKGDIRIRCTVVNLLGRVAADTEAPVESVDLQAFESLIDEAMEAYPSIGAIGFGLPGAEFEGRMLVSDYEALRGLALREHFRDKYRRPVTVENDVNAAAVGFWKRKGVAADATGAYLYIPDRFPPGAGIVIEGKLFRGRRGFAGEVANIPLGISWGEALLLEPEEVRREAAARLTAAVCSVLNPDFVVLNASFIKQGHLPAMAETCGRLLPAGSLTELWVSDDFTADYVSGMVVLTLGTLESGLRLAK